MTDINAVTDKSITIDFDRSRHNQDRDEQAYQARIESLLDDLNDDKETIFEYHINSAKAQDTFFAMFTAFKRGDFKSVELFARNLCDDVDGLMNNFAEREAA